MVASKVPRPSLIERLPPWIDRRWIRPVVGAAAVIAVVAASVPFWTAQLYPPGGFRALPTYWQQTADWLTAHQGDQTALLVPAASFAQYTWGSPEDEPLSVLTNTSVTARSINPLGSDGNTEMLNTVEGVLATGTPQAGLASYLSRSGIDYLVERNDLDRGARGRSSGPGPPGPQSDTRPCPSGGVRTVHLQVPGGAERPTELRLAGLPPPAVRRDLGGRSTRAPVQTFPTADPLVVSGSNSSLLTLSGSGVLGGRAAVLAADPGAAKAAAAPGATLALTDGAQRRAVSFGKIDRNVSYLLSPGQRFGRSGLFPLTYSSIDQPADQSVASPIGAAEVSSSSFGSSSLQDEPSEGPASAFDGDPTTAWVADVALSSVGQWVSIEFTHDVPLRTIAITPLDDTAARPWIEQVLITTDRGSVRRTIPKGSSPVTVGVVPGDTRNLKIRIVKVWKARRHYSEGAGITEVAIPGVTFQPTMRLPTKEYTTLGRLGTTTPILSLYDPVDNPNLDFTGPVTPTEPIARKFELPKAMEMGISGTAVPVPGSALDQLLTQTATPANQSLQVSASSWLRDLPRYRPQNLVERTALPWIAGQDDPHPTVTLRWHGARAVDSIDLGLDPSAARPTMITISSPGGTRTVSVPPTGGIIRFAPMTTDTLTVGFVRSTLRVTAQPIGPTSVGVPRSFIAVPVGLSSISVPAVPGAPPAPVPGSTVVTLACGRGPGIEVDGERIPTTSSGTLSDLVDLQPMPFHACQSPAASLAGGWHLMTFPAGSALRMTVLLGSSLASDSAGPGPTPNSVRSTVTTTAAVSGVRATGVVDWSPARRVLHVGPGPSAYLQVSQNYNPGWVATLGGRNLVGIQLDGWQQGWKIPAGPGGTVTMTFRPDSTYRAGLGLGALLLVVLACLALLGRRNTQYEPVGPRKNTPILLLAVAAVVVTFLIGGLVSALILVPLYLAARRWGSGLMAVVAGVSFFGAGIAVAVDPGTVPGYHTGAFSGAVAFPVRGRARRRDVHGRCRRRPSGDRRPTGASRANRCVTSRVRSAVPHR